MAGNGNGKWTFYLVGLLATLILIIALPTMARQIWENDRKNTDDHKEITLTMVDRDEKLHTDIEDVKEIVTTIQVEQMRQRTILERIEQKL